MVSNKRLQQNVLFPDDTNLTTDPIPDPTWSTSKFLKHSNREDIRAICNRLNRWFCHYPDCEKKEEIRKKVLGKNEGNFNGAYVELLSYIFLRSIGSDVVSVNPPDTSDFLVKSCGITFHVESKSVDGWDEGLLRYENEVVSNIRRVGLGMSLKNKRRYRGVQLYSIDHGMYEFYSRDYYRNRFSNENQWLEFITQFAGAVDRKLGTQIPKREINAKIERVLLGKKPHELLIRDNWCWLIAPFGDSLSFRGNDLVEVREPGHSFCGYPQSEAIASTVKAAGRQHSNLRQAGIPLVVIVNSRGMTCREEQIIAMYGREVKDSLYLFNQPRHDCVWLTKNNSPTYSRIGCVIVFDTAQYPATRLLDRRNLCTAYFNPICDHGLKNTVLGRIPNVSIDMNTLKVDYRAGIDVGKRILEF